MVQTERGGRTGPGGDERPPHLNTIGPLRRRSSSRPERSVVGMALAVLVVTSTTTAILLAVGGSPAQPPRLVLTQSVEDHVLVQKYGHGAAVLRFDLKPHARWEVVCRNPEKLSVRGTVRLKVLGPDGADFGWAYCPDSPSNSTDASNTLPPTKTGPFTVFIDTSGHVSWAFKAFTAPASARSSVG